MPPRNHDRVPIFTAPAPHIMRMANPEQMLREFLTPLQIDLIKILLLNKEMNVHILLQSWVILEQTRIQLY